MCIFSMLLYAAILLFVIYTLYKERTDLGCPADPIGTACNNRSIRVVKDTEPKSTDTLPILYKKIDEAANFSSRWVTWRLSIIVSVVCIFLLYYISFERIPTEVELLVGVLVVSSIVYFTINYYIYHYIDMVRDNIENGIDMVRNKCGSK
jgi:hypothetical protein